MLRDVCDVSERERGAVDDSSSVDYAISTVQFSNRTANVFDVPSCTHDGAL